VQEKQHAYERNDGAFLQERSLERVDGAVDQVGAVIDRNNRRPLRETTGDLGNALLDVGDDGERVLTVTLDGDAGRNLALAIELRDAAAFVRCEFDTRHIFEQHGCAALCLEHDLVEIRDAAQIATTANHELGLGQLHHPTADIHIGSPDGVLDLGQRAVEVLENSSNNHDRILLDETPPTNKIGYTLRLSHLKPAVRV